MNHATYPCHHWPFSDILPLPHHLPFPFAGCPFNLCLCLQHWDGDLTTSHLVGWGWSGCGVTPCSPCRLQTPHPALTYLTGGLLHLLPSPMVPLYPYPIPPHFTTTHSIPHCLPSACQMEDSGDGLGLIYLPCLPATLTGGHTPHPACLCHDILPCLPAVGSLPCPAPLEFRILLPA